MNALTAMKSALELLRSNTAQVRPLYIYDAMVFLKSAITEMERAEPVYQVWNTDNYPSFWDDCGIEDYKSAKEEDRRILFTHPQDRDSIIEECAEHFGESDSLWLARDVSYALRELKGKK